MNTTVIIIMIICATTIALVAIVCDFFFEKKANKIEFYIPKKIVKVHRNYIVGILGFAVIMLITANYGGPNNAIFTYLSFGSTITSFVLSVLAIFVTVQSSSDLYKQFTRIDNATDTIKNASNKIEKTLAKLSEAELKLTESSRNISSQMDDIVMQIDERIKAQIKETEVNISSKLEESLNNLSQTEEQPAPKHTENINNAKNYFMKMTSANGLLAIYACTLSTEKKKQFELTNLFSGNEAYTFGFLIASISITLIQFTHDSTNNIIACSGSLFSSLELLKEIKERLRQQQLGTDYLERLNKINDYFELDPVKVTIE